MGRNLPVSYSAHSANSRHWAWGIRNALEHTYLRVSEGWAKPFMINGTSNNGFGIAIGSDELEAKAIRVMQMARSALFYVSFAIGVEERKKQLANPGQLIGPMPLYGLDDGRKRRDPF
ncbi:MULTISPECIES: LA2681 family HEPN domain-containing protein [unclassified Mesorhizobium]|uniref:LA2681 family HEPN domain-containing protein n=1 Tax=unclassified Mesorhizobium TaxID=325217 RepID=UPI0024793637|nr:MULTISPECIES: LA2681 family HEPN domain-containing protein [unclassified Mesorhizobium]